MLKAAVLVQTILEASIPEDVFGKVIDEEKLSDDFKEMAVLLHPDTGTLKSASAGEAMKRLTELRVVAREKLRKGTYGKSTATIKGKYTYTNVMPYKKGDICDIYVADFISDKPRRAAIKVVSDSRDTDLVENEASVLRELHTVLPADNDGDKMFRRYLPRFIESTKIELGKQQRRANVISLHENRPTLAEVIAAHPTGLDPKHAAWMWRRLLEILSWCHRRGIVHGAVVPQHILIQPENHGLKLLDWSYAVRTKNNEHVKAVVDDTVYPPEVAAKQPATAATDVFMAARVMYTMLAGSKTRLCTAPPAMLALLESCTIHNPARRYNDAWEVYKEFSVIINRLYGKPKFLEFKMPATN